MKFGPPVSADLSWRAQNTVAVTENQASTLLKLFDTLDDNDDVQTVSSNFEISDEIMSKIVN